MILKKPFKIAMIAGEPSGDQLGAALMKALKQQDPSVQVIGIGGPAMGGQGLQSLFPMQELSIMGIWGIVKKLPNLLRRLRQTVSYLKSERPDVLVTIDAPEFCLRVAKRLKGCGIKLVHYTPPTVWAWRPRRAKKIANFLDYLLAIYPFEPAYFEKHGLPTKFVGHAVIEKNIDKVDQDFFRTERHLGNATILTLMPGSRQSEVKSLLPLFKNAVERLFSENKALKVYIPVADSVREYVRDSIKEWRVPVQLIENEAEKYQLIRSSTAVAAASGTVNLELAMANVPFVITYRTSPLNAWLVRRLIQVDFVAMVNIIARREIIPELLQEECTSDNLYETLGTLLYDKEVRKRVKKDLHQVVKQLLPGEGGTPSKRAASTILGLLAR